MNLDQAAQLAQTIGLIMLTLCFATAVIYALWPSNGREFRNAASTPLKDDDHD